MKQFIKNIPSQIASTFTIMCMCFTVISLLKGKETIPLLRLIGLLFIATLGGILMEFAFGKCIFKQMSDIKRVCIFIVPFAIVTFICAVAFRWITEITVMSTYIKFIGIFIGCFLLSVVLFEIEHKISGKKYTEKLREYQNRGGEND